MEAPPQLLKQEVRSLAAQQEETGRQDTFGPRVATLQTFREFMEVERSRTRRRLAALGGGFLFLLLVVIGGGVVVGMHWTRLFRQEVQTLRTALTAANEETRQLPDRAAEMEKAADDTPPPPAAVREPEPAPAPREAVSAPPEKPFPPGLLPEVMKIRADEKDLASRQAALEEEAQRLAGEETERVARGERLAAGYADLARAVKDFLRQQQEQEAGDHGPRATAVEGEDRPEDLVVWDPSRRGKRFGGFKDKLKADPAPVSLDKTDSLRDALRDLESRHAALMEEMNRGEAEWSDHATRRERLLAEHSEVNGGVESLFSRIQGLSARMQEHGGAISADQVPDQSP